MTDENENRPSTTGPIGKVKSWSRLPRDPSRRCKAHRKNGEQCKRPARLGASVCDVHGGKAPQVKAAARRRLDEAADVLAQRLLGIALDGEAPDGVALAAVKDALDRAGLGAKTQVEVDVEVGVKPYEKLLGNDSLLVPMTRAESRARRGIPDPAPQFSQPPALAAGAGGMVDGEVVRVVDRPEPYDGQGSGEMGARSASPKSSRSGGVTGPTDSNATRAGRLRTPPWAEDDPDDALMPIEDAQEIAADRNRKAGIYRP